MPKPSSKPSASEHQDKLLTLADIVRDHKAGRLASANAGYQRLLDVERENADGWHLWGVLAAQEERFEVAVERISRALRLKPQEPRFLRNLGNAYLDLGVPKKAIDCYLEVLNHCPDEDAQIERCLAVACEQQFDRGIAHKKAGQLAEAESCCWDGLRGLPGQPGRADAWHILGVIALDRGQLELAEKRVARAIELSPKNAVFHNSLGAVFLKQRRLTAATRWFRKALRLQSGYVTAQTNLGLVLLAQSSLAEAEAAFRRVLDARPSDLMACAGLGEALSRSGRGAEAEAVLREALESDPDNHRVNYGLGVILRKQNRLAEALACAEKLPPADPRYPNVEGFVAHCKALMCDWSAHAESNDVLRDGVRAGLPCVSPFIFLNTYDDPFEQRQCAETHVKTFLNLPRSRLSCSQRDRIRLAYVSPDFGEHPVSYLITDLIEVHDRASFEVPGISLARGGAKPWRQRLTRAFDRFFDVHGKSDAAVTTLMRDLQIDIAVDLAGYTANSRPAIFAAGAAPIQVNFLGFPGTMGAKFIDYILADSFVIPEPDRLHYAEQVVYLPDTFQSAARRHVAEPTPTRSELGLPEEGFVFCCFNNIYKIHPEQFGLWMRLLRDVPGSVLWLASEKEGSERNLRGEAETRGVDPARLIFAMRVPLEQYLARYRRADLFLDTLPYNAGTTASDALWAGLPVLTCAGRSFASRMAGSLLHAAGLPELVTDNLEAYEQLALKLARDPALLGSIRQSLARNRDSAPLFDLDRFRKHIEDAYFEMFRIAIRGEEPRSFSVGREQ